MDQPLMVNLNGGDAITLSSVSLGSVPTFPHFLLILTVYQSHVGFAKITGYIRIKHLLCLTKTIYVKELCEVLGKNTKDKA